MTETVELYVPARAEYLQLVRVVVGAVAAADPEMVPDRASNLRLAVSEAVSNAIRAQEKFRISDRITIRCNLAEGFIEVEVSDHGPGFDPAELPDLPAVESRERLHHESGLGLYLMRKLTDETTIESGSRGTAVKLVTRYKEGLQNA